MKINKKSIFTFGLSLLFLILVFHGIDFKRLMDTFSEFNYKMLFAIVPLILSAMVLRGVRWKYLLNENKNMSVLELSEIFMVGTALNIYLPARAGDFFRAYFLGEKHNRPKLEVIASIVIERIIDGLTVLFILFSATCLYYRAGWTFRISEIAALFFLGSLGTIYFTVKYNKTNQIADYLKKIFSNFQNKTVSILVSAIEKVRDWINTFLNSASKILETRKLLTAGSISFMIWSIECLIIYILILGFGINIHFSAALFVIGFIALASVIPSSSIYIGPFQYAFILALSIYNIDKSSSLAISFMLQTVNMLVLTIIFIGFAIKNNLNIVELDKSNIQGPLNE